MQEKAGGHDCQYRFREIGFMCTVGGIYALRRLQTGRIVELARRALLPSGCCTDYALNCTSINISHPLVVL